MQFSTYSIIPWCFENIEDCRRCLKSKLLDGISSNQMGEKNRQRQKKKQNFEFDTFSNPPFSQQSHIQDEGEVFLPTLSR